MKTKERRKRLQNKGFTLIELIVTIAIIAIFSGVVLTFISTGSNTYRSTSSSAKVQMETQETFDQIEELIIDVNRSLYYANGSGDSLGAEIKNDIKQSGGADSTGDKTFIICNEYKNGTGSSQYICDVLDWDKDDATIYYSQKEFKAASSSAESETSVESLMAEEDDAEEENAVDAGASESDTKAKDLKTKVDRSVLATGILDFRADVSKVESDKIVRFQLSTQNGTKEIETLHSVSLRNTVEVKKPADSYDDAPSTSVGIKIINAPSSVDPGNFYTLDYDLTGNGNIDPTTVKWEVTANTENGSFPTADSTYGKLTISDKATGTITVIVSARTVDGDTITSAPVTIPINGKAATPDSFTLSTNSILVAAGDGPYDLSTIVKGTLAYSDNTTADVKNPIAWSIKNSCTSVSLNGSSLAVTNEAGKDSSNGTVTLTATEKDSGANKSADLEVRIARIDLTQPVGTYKVGDAKPNSRTAQIYKEAGQDKRITGTEIERSAQKTNGTAGDYLGEANTFSADDVGEWTVNISYDLNKKGGYGTVRSQSTFTVVAKKQNQNIMIANNANIIVANRKYECSYYNPTWGISFPADFQGNWSYQITWNIVNKTSDDTKFEGTNVLLSTDENNRPQLWVGKDEHALTLSADMIVYKKTTQNIAYEFHGERNIPVITGVTITAPDTAEVIKGETYSVHAEIDVWDQNKRSALKNSDKYVIWESLGGQDKGRWTVPADSTENSMRLEASYRPLTGETAPDVFASDDTPISSYRDYNIEEPQMTVTISGDSKEVYVGESLKLTADLDKNGQTYNLPSDESYRIKWKWTKDDGKSGEFSEQGSNVTFTQSETGTYSIVATYTSPSDAKTMSEVYEVIVKNHSYTLTIKDDKGNASGEWYVGDIINLSVNVKDENGKEVTINNPWKDIGWELPNDSWSVSGDNLNPGITTQNLTSGSYTIKATYKPTGATATYNLTLKKLTYTYEIVAEKSTLSPGESTQVYLKVMTERGLCNAQYVNWYTDAEGKLMLNGNKTTYQNDTYMNGKVIPITVTAGTESMDVTIKASFSINYQNYEMKKIIKIK